MDIDVMVLIGVYVVVGFIIGMIAMKTCEYNNDENADEKAIWAMFLWPLFMLFFGIVLIFTLLVNIGEAFIEIARGLISGIRKTKGDNDDVDRT